MSEPDELGRALRVLAGEAERLARKATPSELQTSWRSRLFGTELCRAFILPQGLRVVRWGRR